jgi:hypothetical protein
MLPKKKTRKSQYKPLYVNDYTGLTDAAFVFDYKTESGQLFPSEKERQISLDKAITDFRKAVEQYIESRIEVIQGALIMDSKTLSKRLTRNLS